jgi:hypothetical protein
MKNKKKTPITNIWFSSLNKKLGKAISIALYEADPSGFPYYYQLLYFLVSVKVS